MRLTDFIPPHFKLVWVYNPETGEDVYAAVVPASVSLVELNGRLSILGLEGSIDPDRIIVLDSVDCVKDVYEVCQDILNDRNQDTWADDRASSLQAELTQVKADLGRYRKLTAVLEENNEQLRDDMSKLRSSYDGLAGELAQAHQLIKALEGFDMDAFIRRLNGGA